MSKLIGVALIMGLVAIYRKVNRVDTWVGTHCWFVPGTRCPGCDILPDGDASWF